MTIIGCHKIDKKIKINIEQELADLNSSTDQENYLKSIQESDQKIRNGKSSELLLKYGENSSELQNFYFKMDSIDQLNLKRIEKYLQEFGYPDKDTFSPEANIAPWIVIHHSTNIQERKKFYPILQKAYINQNINPNQLELFLGRTYQLEFGKYPASEGAYKQDEKINKMIKDLNLK